MSSLEGSKHRYKHAQTQTANQRKEHEINRACTRARHRKLLADLPGLQALDAAQHVQVAGGVLLNHILHIVRTQRLLELLLGYVELHDPAQTAERFLNPPLGGAPMQQTLHRPELIKAN